jgi:hypothetical protein
MKRILLLLITCLFFSQIKAQRTAGKVESFVINAKTLQNTGEKMLTVKSRYIFLRIMKVHKNDFLWCTIYMASWE